MPIKSHHPPRIESVTVKCASAGCNSQLTLPGGTAVEFFERFEAAHFEGWLCLVKTPFDITCPSCNEKRPRTLQRHQVLREKLADQPTWKRDIALAVWAAMSHVNDSYLRETEMPAALSALLGKETATGAAHVRQALEHIDRAFSRREHPNAAEAARLANVALAR